MFNYLFSCGLRCFRWVWVQSKSADNDSWLELWNYIQFRSRKLEKTTEYIYQHGFVGQNHSDITLSISGILEKELRLHKLILCQSPYFEKMFKDENWMEGDKKKVETKIYDEKITEGSLMEVLGSLYSAELHFGAEDKVVGIIATARFFLLDQIVDAAEAFILSTITAVNVIKYYQTAIRYMMQSLEAKLFKWLTMNFCAMEKLKKLEFKCTLELIDPDVMGKLVACQDSVVGNEVQLYTILKEWVAKITEYEVKSKDEKSFLELEEGKSFTGVFSHLRLTNLIYSQEACDAVTTDGIIPNDWINTAIIKNWKRLQNFHVIDVNEKSFQDDFSANAFRLCLCFDSSLVPFIEFNHGLDKEKTKFAIRINENAIEIRVAQYFDRKTGRQIISPNPKTTTIPNNSRQQGLFGTTGSVSGNPGFSFSAQTSPFAGSSTVAPGTYEPQASVATLTDPITTIIVRVSAFAFGKLEENSRLKRSEIMKIAVGGATFTKLMNLDQMPIFPFIVSLQIESAF